MAATMLGQGKNTWQAEIDAAAEVSPRDQMDELRERRGHICVSSQDLVGPRYGADRPIVVMLLSCRWPTSSGSRSSLSSSCTPSSLQRTRPESGSEGTEIALMPSELELTS